MSELPPYSPPTRRFSWALAFVLVALIGALLTGFLVYRAERMASSALPGAMEEARKMGRFVADGVKAAFGFEPRVTFKDRVVVEQATNTLELAVVTRDVEVEKEVEHTHFHSTKKLRVRATYRVRAGYDLTKPFEIRLEEGRVAAKLPPPILLGADQLHVEVAEAKDGLWNKVQPSEVADVVRLLPGQAARKAREAGILDDAAKSVREQLQEKLGRETELEIAPADTKAPAL